MGVLGSCVWIVASGVVASSIPHSCGCFSACSNFGYPFFPPASFAGVSNYKVCWSMALAVIETIWDNVESTSSIPIVSMLVNIRWVALANFSQSRCKLFFKTQYHSIDQSCVWFTKSLIFNERLLSGNGNVCINHGTNSILPEDGYHQTPPYTTSESV